MLGEQKPHSPNLHTVVLNTHLIHVSADCREEWVYVFYNSSSEKAPCLIKLIKDKKILKITYWDTRWLFLSLWAKLFCVSFCWSHCHLNSWFRTFKSLQTIVCIKNIHNSYKMFKFDKYFKCCTAISSFFYLKTITFIFNIYLYTFIELKSSSLC